MGDNDSEESMIELGGNITLGGFKDLDRDALVVVKKMVGSYARKMTDHSSKFENITVTLKDIHKTSKTQSYEVHVKLIDAGKPINSEITDRNMYVALDSALKKVLAQLTK